MKLAALLCTCLLGSAMAIAQDQTGGTVNSMSVDPQQNQKMTGSMGTTTGQPNDVTPHNDAATSLGNPGDQRTPRPNTNGNYAQAQGNGPAAPAPTDRVKHEKPNMKNRPKRQSANTQTDGAAGNNPHR